jgi:type II secretory pathway predicted ATPase ExeA
MEYYKYYGLKLEPFSNTPDTRFYFNSDQHTAALAKILYAVKNMKGLALLIGDVGTGKTTMARKLLSSLPDEEYEATLLVIIHSSITADWLLTKIATQLGVDDPAEDKVRLLGQLYQRLVEIQESGKTAIVLVDEAQMLNGPDIMEEFRGLLNLEIPGKKFISFILFGLPELEENLKQDEPLNQRVALRYFLNHLNLTSTENYIKHRLIVAGAQKMFFTKEAIKSIQIYSKGIPRVINTLCDNALLEGMLRKAELIDRAIIEKVAHELRIEPGTTEELRKIELQELTSLPPSEEKPQRNDSAGKKLPDEKPAPQKRSAAPGGVGKKDLEEEEDVDIEKILDTLDIK